jgi:DinB superfamily
MHPRLAAVISYADQARAELLAAVDEIPEPLREARPTEEAWSVAEILEHLSRVERGIAKLVALKVGEMQTMAEPPRESPEMLDVDDARFVLVQNRNIRRDAPDRVAPRGELSAEAARAALLETRGVLLDQLHAADGLALSTILHPHPFLGELNVYEWVHFVAGHEQRHLAQVRELGRHFDAT